LTAQNWLNCAEFQAPTVPWLAPRFSMKICWRAAPPTAVKSP
jgi:hypothetical protein